MKTILLFTIFIFCIFSVNAQSGNLDKSFGIEGKTMTNFGISTNPEPHKGLLQKDNKPIITGHYSPGYLTGSYGLMAVRYTVDGFIDQSYGDSGKTVIKLSFEDDAFVRDAALQQSGKLLIAGYGYVNYFDPVYSGIIVRLSTNGGVDSSFGVDGAVQLKLDESSSYNTIAVLPDDKIIVSGKAGATSFLNRYSPDGKLDSTFGENGFAYYSNIYGFFSMKIDTEGRIVCAGLYYGLEQSFCLQRYMPDGTLDVSFGNNGTVVTDYEDALLYDMIIQPDGKILITGQASEIINWEVITFLTAIRYKEDGSLDSSFDEDGKFTLTAEGKSYGGRGIAIDKNKKIIVGGSQFTDTSSDFILIRLNEDGSPDLSFGENGMVITEFGPSISSYVRSVLLQSSGKIVAAGGATDYNDEYDGRSLALARYNNDVAAPPPTPIARIKRWLHKHGITWDDCPPSICNNITGYAVQRSNNGVAWSTVHRQQSTVNGQRSTVNSYADLSPLPGTNYYRLQTTSVDGVVAYSNMVAISNELSAIRISPNPAKSVLGIERLPSNQKTKITVVNLSGNVAISLQLSANSSSSHNLNIAQLKPGNYLLRVETESEVVTRQFVKE